jgi:UDP-glucose:(heptosyl)LPS alpha-1,3-glucosyltransferase
MKIGIIFGMEFSKPNGISRYVIELAQCLNYEDEVHLLIADDHFNLPNLIIHKNPLSIISRIRFYSNISSLKSVLHIFDITFRLIFNSVYNPFFSRKIKKKYGLDIIHSQSIDSLTADIVTMHSCYKTARKVEDESHETNLPRRLIGKLLFFPFNSSYLITEKQIVKNSKKIIVVSDKLKRDFINCYGVAEDKIAVIPNGVNLNIFKPNQTARRKIRSLYGFEEDEIILIFVGHMFKAKGLDYIIEAISNLTNVKLLVVGEDPNIEAYRENVIRIGIQEKVIFAGKILNGIEEYYAASDIFLLPSSSEGFPISGIEAAATGLPVICTKVAGLDEMIIDSYNGFFVNRDSEQIKEKLQILIKNDDIRKQMGINARETAVKYSWENVTKRTLQVYKEVV